MNQKWSAEKELYLIENVQNQQLKDIARHLNVSVGTINNYVRRLGLKKNRKKVRSTDRLEKIGYKVLEYREGKVLVECKYCGSKFWTKSNKLLSYHTKSCGCTAIGRRKGTKNVSSTFWSRLVQHAKLRDNKVYITIDDIEELYIKQEGKCKLSGRKLIAGYHHLNDITMSVDRIDSSKGYIKGNIQLLHKEVNLAKQSSTQEDFIKMCREVSQHAS